MRWMSKLVYPFELAWTLTGLGILAYLARWSRVGMFMIVLAFAWLWLWSMPVISDHVRLSLENRYPELPVEQVQPADAVVVLGGAFSHIDPYPYPRFSDAGNRYWHAARLFHAGRGQRLILSGGRSPHRAPGLTEAESGAVFLKDMGVPESALLLDNFAMTTRENAVNISEMLEEIGAESFLLVTSALHMRRSEAAFRALGLDPVVVATDFRVRSSIDHRLHRWLPSLSALSESRRAIHEYVGYWYYSLRGWI